MLNISALLILLMDLKRTGMSVSAMPVSVVFVLNKKKTPSLPSVPLLTSLPCHLNKVNLTLFCYIIINVVLTINIADAFHAKFGATYHPDTKLYRIKCSEIKDLPVLKMTLEDHIVEIPASYWTSTVDKNRDCCSTTLGRSNSERDWVLGTSFTNAFYTTFDPDNETVGLAIKKGQKDDGLRVYKKTH
jgi:hypothetical protein